MAIRISNNHPLATISHFKKRSNCIFQQHLLLADSFVIDSLRFRGKNIEGREGGV
jgi:hypothetical protein